MQAAESHCWCNSSASRNKNSGWNGGTADGMAESNGRRNGGMAGMAGMAELRKEWQNSRMAEMATYVLFTVHTHQRHRRRWWRRRRRRHFNLLYYVTLTSKYALDLASTLPQFSILVCIASCASNTVSFFVMSKMLQIRVVDKKCSSQVHLFLRDGAV